MLPVQIEGNKETIAIATGRCVINGHGVGRTRLKSRSDDDVLVRAGF